jgi:hypothetical protein
MNRAKFESKRRKNRTRIGHIPNFPIVSESLLVRTKATRPNGSEYIKASPGSACASIPPAGYRCHGLIPWGRRAPRRGWIAPHTRTQCPARGAPPLAAAPRGSAHGCCNMGWAAIHHIELAKENNGRKGQPYITLNAQRKTMGKWSSHASH